MSAGDDNPNAGPEESAQGPAFREDDRLNSWKEIAVYLNRDVRTVRRWENDQALPVHRHQHQKAASVYAYRSEIDRWWQGEEEREKQQASVPAPDSVRNGSAVLGFRSRRNLWIVAGLVLTVVACGALLLRRRTRFAPASVGKPTFAVLPFQNLTGDPAQDFVSDGLTEEMITEISEVEGNRLDIIARTSSMAYKKSRKSIKQIGKELNADYMLEGSVRRWGDHVRVSAQLIDAKTQAHIWGQNFESDQRDILQLQSDIADAIAHQIQQTIPGATAPAAAKARPADPHVYELCLLGRYEWNKRTNEGLKKAVEYYEQAVARDPRYAPARAGLAEAYFIRAYYSKGFSQKFLLRAQAAAERAIRLDDRSFSAHAVVGIVESSYWRPGAGTEFRRALAINPSYATAHHWYAYYLWRVGRRQDALAEIERARQLDPVSPIINTDEAMFRLAAGQIQEAIRQLTMTIELAPDFADAHRSLAVVYAKTKKYEDALAEARKATDLNPGNMGARATLGYVYAASGDSGNALKILRELKVAGGADALCYELWIQFGLGEDDLVFEELQQEYQAHSPDAEAIALDPILEPLQADARYHHMIEDLKNAL